MATAAYRQSILQVLDQLPPLHRVAQKLIALMDDERSSARDLDRLILNDQALTARILKLANSSAYGKSRNIFKLTEAIVLLGHTTIGNLVVGATVADVMTGGEDREFASQAWKHSLDCAAVSQALAELTGCVQPENAFVAGLLHDIGLLVQAQAVPEVMREVIASNPEDPLAAERQALGLNHAQVGLKLLDRWRLPVPLCEAVRFHHTPNRKYQRTNPLVNIVALADQLTSISGNSVYPRQIGTDVFQLMQIVGIETVQYDRMFSALNNSRNNVRCLLDEVQLSPPQTVQTEPANIQPVAVYAANAKRHAWYTSLLTHLGVPVVNWQVVEREGTDDHNVERIVIDFTGVAPSQRQMLSQVVTNQDLAPVVVGDRRHTPRDEGWQRVPHIPESFALDDILESLGSACPFAV